MSLTLSREGLADQVRLASSPARLRRPAFMVIDALQRSEVTGGEQLLSLAVTLRAMCESANVPLGEVLSRAASITADVEGPFTAHLQAVRDFASKELRRYR
jgi:hypothetical protein